MQHNKVKIILNAYSLFIVQQVIIIFLFYYVTVSKSLVTPYLSYYSAFYLSVIYLAVLFGYIKFNHSIKMGILFGSMQYLIFKPLNILLFPYSCGKCDYSSLSDLILPTFIGQYFFILIIILFLLLFLFFSKYIPKCKYLYYILPLAGNLAFHLISKTSLI